MLLRVGSFMLVWAVGLCGAQMTFAQSSVSGQRPFDNLRAEYHSASQRYHLDYDRNAAWPVPFNRLDRATYYEFFQPCLDRGWEIEHTLSDACFDAQGRLNNLGATKIAQAIRNAPLDRRTLFIYNLNPAVAEQRLEEVRQHIQVEFGRSANLMVAATDNFPVTGRGIYAEAVTRNFQQNLPPPVLNVQAVGGALSGGNN